MNATSPTSNGIALSCRNLHKRYGEVVAVDGLDLEVCRGECFGLLGPNGAGKTTTIEILEGLNTPDAGDVEVLGQRWGQADDRQLRQRLGIQLQETRLAEKLTVEETIRLFRSFYDRGPDPLDVLARVGLQEKRKAWVTHLSGGQRQRLSVACTLVSDPEVLFLDEPTTGLDPQSRRQLWDLVDQFRSGGGTVILTTHYMDEAHRLCDRVAIVDRGKVIALGTPDELIAMLGAEHVVEFSIESAATGEIDPESLSALPGVRQVRREAGVYALNVGEVHVTVPALLRELQRLDVVLSQLTTHHATLEDVFVNLTGRTLRDE